MAKPVEGDWHKLIRLGRYLKPALRCVLTYLWQEVAVVPHGFSDSEWACCRKTGKSTSGGLVMVGRHLVKSWSRTQDSVTLSSAGAELIALGKLAAETLGVRSMMADYSMVDSPGPSTLFADASAALSIAKRDGAGKMRHINVRGLWLQEKTVRQELTYRKVKEEDNPADGLTKHVRQELAEKYAISIGVRLGKDRAKSSLRATNE